MNLETLQIAVRADLLVSANKGILYWQILYLPIYTSFDIYHPKFEIKTCHPVSVQTPSSKPISTVM